MFCTKIWLGLNCKTHSKQNFHNIHRVDTTQGHDLCFHEGNTLALEVSNLDGDNTQSPVEGFRALCGPSDPVTAQAVRPKSLRAQFGITKVQNAVHCTDLEENAAEEIRIAFGSS